MFDEVDGYSVVGAGLEGGQRRFYVSCRHCGEYQILEWGGKDVTHGIKWDKDEQDNALSETAHYVCQHHGCVIEE
ncbi:phage terminase large subunit family protein [Commensalibacter communis]|uniref:phage terminase large subunit family protein n=1 Tax=Commensalibacter communis TaxID=2972786 RepID=UPI0022FF9A14|nr:phage terminase large subunit family protein [Commensalibacter communis]CAI3960441.1 Phage terminase [Commensalibacter communis]CAI3960475.1 Phage terminase [Commensalibacter communis]